MLIINIMCWDVVEKADMSTDLVIQSNKIRTTKAGHNMNMTLRLQQAQSGKRRDKCKKVIQNVA